MKRRGADVWNKRIVSLLREMSGVDGKMGGEPPIASMGTTAPPLVEDPSFIVDHLISDGAQVTRPSIDPYREPIETHIYIIRSGLRLSMPVMISGVEGLSSKQLESVSSICYRLGILLDFQSLDLPEGLVKRYKYVLSRLPQGSVRPGWFYTMTVNEDELAGIESIIEEVHGNHAYIAARCASISKGEFYVNLLKIGFDAIIIDEDLEGSSDDLELAVAEADTSLKSAKLGDFPARWGTTLIAVSERVRGSHDVYKLLGLGAEVVGIRKAWKVATDLSESLDPSLLSHRLENFLIAMQKEIKLLAGAAGISSLHSSLVGSRELFRAIELEEELRKRLGVRPAGL